MLQSLAFKPPSLHLPTVVRLRLACQVLSKDINLDVFRPSEPARALRETNLTDKFLAPFKEPTTKTILKFLAVKWLYCELSMACVWHPRGLLPRVEIHPIRHTHTGVVPCRHLLPRRCRTPC